MAATEGHKKAAHSAIPWHGCVPLRGHSFGEDSEVDSLLSERDPQPKVSGISKKHGPMLSSSASSHDLRGSDMEKEKQDGSSPRGVIEACLQGLESDVGSTKDSTAVSGEHHSNSRALSNWSRFFKSWKKLSPKRLTSWIPPPVPKATKSKSSRENPVLRDLYNFKSKLQHFTFPELKIATDDFSQENLIGRGGFADVYKGCLPDGKLVAVKQLTTGTVDEKTAGFLSELGILAHVDHPNTAKLLGCGIDGGMHLVFEFSSQGSLGSALHGSQVKLDWCKRHKIALGTADGLLYLHENCRKRIIHRDIKANNILLTENFEPQICDFGLAKWLPKEWTHHNISKFEGTFGYFAPEYFMHGIVDEKTDIYAFGVLLLELITGRRPVDPSQQSLVVWAKPLLDNNNIKELADPSLGENFNPEEMDRMVLTASLCTEQSPILRPRMSQIVTLLRGDEYVTVCAKKSQQRSLLRTFSQELLDAQDYNSTKYLKDLKRHKELVLDS